MRCAALALLVAVTPLRAQEVPVYYDYVEGGQLRGGRLTIDLDDPADRAEFGLDESVARGSWPATTIIDNGPSANRIDLVMLGDGYTDVELAAYAQHVDNVLTSFLAEEPLAAYAAYFNVHRVDVVSNESGVDEPDEGIFRDTALDMSYNCSGIARLLCISISKALAAAGSASDVDQILALANSTRYGGAGYPFSNLGTLAGNNSASIEIALHEFGHSFADLADEYDYDDGDTYTGSEPDEANVSIYEAATQIALETKWWLWMDLPHVDTYEGAMYHEFGIYRPTSNSKMRSLDRPFQEINVEQFVIHTYMTVSPIDDATPPSPEPLPSCSTFFVSPMAPTDHSLDIQWWVDGVEAPGATGTTFTPDVDPLPGGIHEISVTVVDNTTRVRDESARAAWLIDSRQWEIDVLGVPHECDGDCNTNGIPDTCDLDCTAPDCDLPGCGASTDCNTNGVLDECELPVRDCNGNTVPDDCDIAGATSSDCQPNGSPDECELTGNDCNTNGMPDDCEADCNANGTPDACDLDVGTSHDCNENAVPDECDLADRLSRDCNRNIVPDDCDIAEGTSRDCNTNGWPDECDVEICTANGLWDGFQVNPPFTFQTPLDGVDYDGDGFAWANPIDPPTAIIFPFGCETGDIFDNAVQVLVDPGIADPADGYVESEYFRTDDGAIPLPGQFYSLRLLVKVEEAVDSETDWELSVHDGSNGGRVAVVRFASTVSTTTGSPGSIVVEYPAGAYIDTGVPVVLGACLELQIDLNANTGEVQVYIDGDPKLNPPRPPRDEIAGQMDYFRVRPALNGASSHRSTTFRIDHVDLCLTGEADSPPEIGDFDGDGSVDLTDYDLFRNCLTGPGSVVDAGCEDRDFDCDADVDFVDYAQFAEAFAASAQ